MLVGIHIQDKHVHDSKNGDGIAIHTQEGTENWMGLVKDIAEKRIKPNGPWVRRLFDYIDLYIHAGIDKDMLDYRLALRKALHFKNLIWDDNSTADILFEIENNLPPNCKRCLHLIDKIEFGMCDVLCFVLLYILCDWLCYILGSYVVL